MEGKEQMWTSSWEVSMDGTDKWGRLERRGGSKGVWGRIWVDKTAGEMECKGKKTCCLFFFFFCL